jgi:hypothetical protein
MRLSRISKKCCVAFLGEDVVLKIHLAPTLAPIKADSGQIEQIVMNLAVNARDAMPEGGQLTIETANFLLDVSYPKKMVDMPPGRYALLAISDTGCGMDAKTQARIFEPFFTTKETGKGTGLGWSIVYGIVNRATDLLGHVASDQLLTVVASRIKQCLRTTDTIARVGPDEFSVLLYNVGTPEIAGRLAQRIVHALKAPLTLAKQEVFIAANIGIVLSAPVRSAGSRFQSRRRSPAPPGPPAGTGARIH